MLRIGPLTLIPALITELGHEPAGILAEGGCTTELLANPCNSMSFLAACKLLAVCSQRLNCPHFGVLLGKHVKLSHFGMLGVLLRNSCHAQEALTHLVRYQRFQTQVDDLVMHIRSDRVYLFYREPLGVPGNEQLGSAVLAGLCSILRALCGSDCVPNSVCFAHAMPPDTRPFNQHFKCQLSFSENEYVISYPSRHLIRPLGNIEYDLKKVIFRQVENELFPPDVSFASNVYALIETSIRSGSANSATIAAMMGVSVRTLSRHLELEGLNFQGMLDEVKCKTATSMLNDIQLDIARIADFLGYNDVTSFSRAFRRWRGITPAEWRSNIRRYQ